MATEKIQFADSKHYNPEKIVGRVSACVMVDIITDELIIDDGTVITESHADALNQIGYEFVACYIN